MGTAELSVQFSGPNQTSGPSQTSGNLHGYLDSDFAGDIELRKSTSGYIFFFAGRIISAQSKRQLITALLTTEAEYYGLAKASTKATWLRETLKELKYKATNTQCVIIYRDNQVAL